MNQINWVGDEKNSPDNKSEGYCLIFYGKEKLGTLLQLKQL